MTRILIFSIILSIFFSCSTDVDLNADYKDITVVYGLLDYKTDYQYIKVNKAFLGDASVAEMAQVSDSFTYKEADVIIKKYKNDKYVKTFNFEYCDTIKKEPGFFANDKNVIYISNEKLLDNDEINNISDFKFELIVKIPGKPEVTSETKLVSDVKLLSPVSYPSYKLSLYRPSYSGSGTYLTQEYKFTSAANAILYEPYLEIYYYEKYYDSNEYKLKTLKWRQINKRSKTKEGNETILSKMSGAAFYSYISNSITYDENIEQRIFYAVRFYFITAGETLTKYIDLTSPNYSIVEERPAFTNINNGWGLFSSRSTTISNYKRINDESITHLKDNDSPTAGLKFLKASETTNFYYVNSELDFEDLY